MENKEDNLENEMDLEKKKQRLKRIAEKHQQ